MKRYSIAFILLIISHLCFAEKGESSRILIHTLNYLSQDYAGAVKNGKVISASEFREMREFGESSIGYFKDCSTNWSKQDSAAIRVDIYHLDSLIEKHAPFEIVSSTAIAARDKIIKASGLVITPSTYPNIENGKAVFKTECSKCHGDNGTGDGPEGKDLNPKPRNFHDNEKMKTLSPFFVFNTVRLGVEGTGMKAHPTLNDNDVWDVAFYVLSFRYQQYKNEPFLKSEETKESIEHITLDDIATKSDDEFFDSFHTDTTKAKHLLSAIRLNQPQRNNSEFINTSLKYLDGAMNLYMQGKHKEASQLATLSYLEGIEPIEMQLRPTDPQLMNTLETQMQRLSKLMEQDLPVYEIKDSLNAAKKTLHSAAEVLNKKEYSFFLALLMAVSILLREGLEAFLVIMVILSILKATELKNPARWVHAGWITAVLVGVVIWSLSGRLIQGQLEHNMELVEGIISVLAVFMLLYVGFWLHGKSEINKWRDYVTKMMKNAVKSGSLFGLAALSFFVVFREVFESVLFLSALNIESAGKQSNAIVLGVVIAFVIVITLALFLLRFSTKLPVPKLFKISSLVMGILAVVLAGKGIHSFQETGHVPVHGLAVMRVELLGVFPTIETCAAQLAVIFILVVVWNITLSPKNKK